MFEGICSGAAGFLENPLRVVLEQFLEKPLGKILKEFLDEFPEKKSA